MGLDVSAQIVAAVRYDSFVKKTDKEKEVIKYDENTGKQYTKKLTETFYKIGAQIYTEKEWNDGILSDILDEHDLTLTDDEEWVMNTLFDTESHRYIVSNDDNCITFLTIEEIEKRLKEAQRLFKTLGIDKEKIRLFLFNDISY